MDRGIDMDQKNLLVELMEAQFAVVETALYLNTHPEDERALRLHNNNSMQYTQLKDLYESRYGLLTSYGMSRYPWSYINSPWPWEINFDNF